MPRHSIAWRMLILSLWLWGVLLSGCHQTAPEKLTAETVPAGDKVARLGDKVAISKSATASDVTGGSVGTAVPKVQTPVMVSSTASPASIGPGNFNGHRETAVSHSSGARALAVSPDGKFVIVSRQLNQTGGCLQVWDIANARLINELFEPRGVTTAAFAPDSQAVAYGAGDGSIVMQPILHSQARRWNGSRFSIRDLAFSSDGKRLASLGSDNRLILWDAVLAAMIAETASDTSHVRFASPDRLWTWTESGTIQWYDYKSGSLMPGDEFKFSEGIRSSVTDGHKLYGLRPDRTLHIVDAMTGRDLPVPPFDTSSASAATENSQRSRQDITAIAIAATSHDFAMCSADGELTVWKSGDPGAKRSWSLNAGYANLLASDSEGRFWAVQTAAGGLLVFDCDRPESPQWLERAGSAVPRPPISARFSSAGETVVSSRNSETLILSQIATGQTRRRMVRPDSSDANPVTVLLAARDDVVVCGTKAGALEIWTTASMMTPIPVSKAAISTLAETPDGRFLLTGDIEGTTTWLDRKTSTPSAYRAQTGRITAAAISPDGRWAATASDDQSVVLWDVARQSQVWTLRGHGDPVQAVVFSPDSKWLVSGDRHGTVIVWDALMGTQTWSSTLPEALMQPQNGIAPTPNRNAPNSDQAAGVPIMPTATQPGVQSPDSPAAAPLNLIEDVAVTASAGADSRSLLSNLAGCGISALTIRGDQRVLAVGTATGYTQTFDLTRRQALSAVYHQAPVNDLAFATNGASLLVATEQGDVSRWWQAPNQPRMLSGHQGNVRFAALDASGKSAVTGGIDKRLCVWNVDSGTLLFALDNEGEAIVSGALSPEGHRAVTGGYGSGLVFWDLAAKQRLAKRYGHGKRVLSLAFSRDGNWVASGCEDRTVKVWDFVSQKMKQTIAHDAPVHFAAFSPDGAQLLTSTIDPRGWQVPARVQLWDTATGKPLREFHGHRTTVNAAVFSPDGREIVSCGADGQLCRWLVATGERIQESYCSNGLSHAALIDGGRLLVMRRFNNGVVIHDSRSMARLSEFDVPTRSVGDLNVATQGNRIVAGTEEGPVYVWSIRHE